MSTTIWDLTSEYRRRQLPRFEGNDGQHNRFSNLCDWLDDEYGDQPAADFGPRRLTDLRDEFVKAGLSRKYINAQVRNVIRIFKFGVARELFPADRLTALEAVEPLRYGEAHEPDPRRDVSLDELQAVLPHLSPMMAAMVVIQFSTGCRPSELFRMTSGDIDRGGDVWVYRPGSHKTKRFGRIKAIPMGTEAQQALTPYLGRPDKLCFITAHGNPWNRNSYRQELYKACDRAGIDRFPPYSLRNAAADVVNEKMGIEFAKAMLGHASESMTRHYARLSEQRQDEQRAIAAAQIVPRIAR